MFYFLKKQQINKTLGKTIRPFDVLDTINTKQ